MINETISSYDQQAQAFLDKFGVKFRSTLSDSKPCPWKDDDKIASGSGHHYRVTLSKSAKEEVRTYRGQEDGCMKVGPFQYPASRITFDFWGSITDAEQGILTVTPYDVLACISSDASVPDSFEDFCGEFGYEQDSIKALQTYRRCSAFAKRLNAFFTQDELTALQEIQ